MLSDQQTWQIHPHSLTHELTISCSLSPTGIHTQVFATIDFESVSFFSLPFFNMATGSDFVWYPIKQLAAIVDGQSDVMGCIVEKPSVGAFEWVFFGTTVECPATD